MGLTERVLIMGAAGRDFHVFNTCYRERDDVQVVAFTATQIPHISGRIYPAGLAGEHYPDGIPIHPEDELEALIRDQAVDTVIFAYSDVHNEYVAERRVRVERAGAEFRIFDVDACMLKSERPVIAVCGVRTGSGKSEASRRIVTILGEAGARPVVVRHPMPYGDLASQAVQRFASLDDLDTAQCTVEEREEYEPHLRQGAVVYAGVDYAAVLAAAEKDGDVIVWDGGNNDTPFLWPDLWITVADPHRPGDELAYFPGKINFAHADLILINKAGTAPEGGVDEIVTTARQINPSATIVVARSPVTVAKPKAIAGKRVLVIEDGPTVTHGGMAYGAGVLAARRYGASKIVDPRSWAVGEIVDTFDQYRHVGPLLPAMGYGPRQLADLAATINAVDCDLVLIATPVDLAALIDIDKPSLRVSYELQEFGAELGEAVRGVLRS
jgi:predicted GTPase